MLAQNARDPGSTPGQDNIFCNKSILQNFLRLNLGNLLTFQINCIENPTIILHAIIISKINSFK